MECDQTPRVLLYNIVVHTGRLLSPVIIVKVVYCAEEHGSLSCPPHFTSHLWLHQTSHSYFPHQRPWLFSIWVLKDIPLPIIGVVHLFVIVSHFKFVWVSCIVCLKDEFEKNFTTLFGLLWKSI